MSGPSMRHYGIAAWADHIRGLGAAKTRRRLRRHLSRCARCRRLAEELTEFAAVVRADADLLVPDEVVKAALSLFRERQVAPRDRRRL